MLDYLHVHRPWTWKKDKVQVPQRNEMLSLYCTAFGFIGKNEEYNPKEKITVDIWKTWCFKNLLNNRT